MTLARKLGIAAVAATAMAAACADPPSRPPPADNGVFYGAGGGGSADGGAEGGADAAVDGGACNSLALTGLLVDRIGVIGDPPVSTGGSITDGDYDLTDYAIYVGTSGTVGPTGVSARQSLRIAAGVVDTASVVTTNAGDAGPTQGLETRATSRYTTQGSNLFFTATCPSGGPGRQQSYTAAGGTLVIVDAQAREQFTYTRR